MVIGLTGGIGSGKTTVAKIFQELGAELFIADIEAKKLMVEDKELISQITTLFGNKAYLNNQLNKPFIASMVFNDSSKLKQLNSLVHPKVRERFNQFKQEAKSPLLIYEAAILFESGSDTLCNYIITVTADLKDKIDRIIARDSVTLDEIKSRMNNQLNDKAKIDKSHFVICNTNIIYTAFQVHSIYKILLNSIK